MPDMHRLVQFHISGSGIFPGDAGPYITALGMVGEWSSEEPTAEEYQAMIQRIAGAV